eukprot:scaffold92306_cov35-Attheya_sp.AAC.1
MSQSPFHYAQAHFVTIRVPHTLNIFNTDKRSHKDTTDGIRVTQPKRCQQAKHPPPAVTANPG